MALTSAAIGTSNTTIYSSTGNNAITCMIFCNIVAFDASNPNANIATLTLYAVPNGATLSNNNLIAKAIPITAGETLSFDQEKLVLGNGDTLVAVSDTASRLVVTISTLAV
jgi:hypothetical protein